jgi:surfeit locus 1 family protein
VILLVATVVVATVCVLLGFWQLDRLEQRRAFNAQVENGLAQPPAPLSSLLEAGDDLAYRRTEARGRFDPSGELLLYGRTMDGRPGDHVLTPFVTDDGTTVLVDRGWIPFDATRQTPVGGDAAAPPGEVRIEGVLVPSDTGDAFPTEGAGTTVRSRNVDQIAARTGRELVPTPLLLQAQEPPQPADSPRPAALPELTEGSHLSYAFQWFAFGAIAVVGYVVLMRWDRRTRRPGEVPAAAEGR